eukprot:CAMPEP_0117007774 /NCGR_PEP_ID=MMETSP0472-20121206/7534_1 /TAXON_ID=693140 ORGANISM="Tiarina fusus, Strain LIS" /NCGR_SAMPLE_ID=MMETSP0472 /ASSEMBLY_ACC=CAM_ASM_000603 /LENGTH=398 /DNA_ID=CAMNT_0004709639 /DNA_START=309 /DNA_END=1505 /DNA_ORIENTATION=-
MLSRRSLIWLCLCASVLALSTTAQEAEDQGQSPPVTTTEDSASTPETTPAEDAFNAQDHMDWGSYYDPQNVFCGQYDCYKILGFDYEEFGKEKPDTKVITKRYRSLSREWHPDKSKHKDAKERFVKIARAYEVLTDSQKRTEYDYMRYNQEAYFQTYGASVLWHYAPKSDATIIIFLLIVAANAFTWVAQKHRWQMVADRLSKAACEDWSPSMGGTVESKQLREEALVIFQQRAAKKDDDPPPTNGKVTKKGSKKVSGKEKKKQEQEELRPIVWELVDRMDDFGAGFHKPTWRDLFLVRMVKFPFYVATGVLWQAKYVIRRLQKKELNDEERAVLTERAVGHVTWDLASDEEKGDMIKRELWILDNLVEWKEEQEVRTWSKADQKYYAKMKKKGIKDL